MMTPSEKRTVAKLTTPTQRAALYRKATRLLEHKRATQAGYFACWAIEDAVYEVTRHRDDGVYIDLPITDVLIDEFGEHFKPEDKGYLRGWWDEKGQGFLLERLIALDLMALIAEESNA